MFELGIVYCASFLVQPEGGEARGCRTDSREGSLGFHYRDLVILDVLMEGAPAGTENACMTAEFHDTGGTITDDRYRALFLEVIHVYDLEFGLLYGVNKNAAEFFFRDAKDGREVFA